MIVKQLGKHITTPSRHLPC